MNLRGLSFLIAGVVLLGVLFVLFRPGPDTPVATAPTAAAPAPAAQPPAAPELPIQPRTYEWVVRDGKLASGPDVIKVVAGDELELRVTADRADELHLHGYDLSLRLEPGVPAELRVLATRTGRFEFELHKAHADVGVLEVHPK